MKNRFAKILILILMVVTFVPAMSFAAENTATNNPVLLLKAATSGTKAVKLSWNKVDGASKYVVYGNRCGKSHKKILTTKKNSCKVKKIKKTKLVPHKNYKFYVVAYKGNKKIVKSKTIHFITANTAGKYGNVSSITAKYKTLSMYIGDTKTVSAKKKIYKNKKHITKGHGVPTSYISSNKAVATVSSNGKVEAKSVGTARIYIIDTSGKYCSTKVTVSKKPEPTQNYVVEHYQQNVTGDGYTLTDTENLSGEAGTEVTATAKTYVGFTENITYKDRKASGTIAEDGSLVLQLYYDRNTNDVSYGYTNDPTPEGASALPEKMSYRYGAEVSVAAVATATGYTFGGWTTEDVTVNEGKFEMPDKAVVFSGTFTVKKYTISFNNQGYGKAPASIENVEHGAKIEKPTDPAAEGYTFDGWYKEAACTNAWNFDSDTVTEDTTLYARWTINSYNVAAQVQGSHGTATVKVNNEEVSSAAYASSVVYSATADAGYEFDYWEVVSGGIDIDSVKNNATITVTMPANALTIKAHFKVVVPDTYSIIVENDGYGTAVAQVGGENVESAAPEANVTLIPTANDGYVFKAWQITRGLASDAITDNSFTMPSNEVKIKAVFEREYAIEVEAGGHGSASADVQKGVSGKEVTLTITPDEGYVEDQINVVRGGVTVTDNKFKIGVADVKIRVTFKAIVPAAYDIIIENDGHGTAKAQVESADVESAAPEANVTLIPTANDGYVFKAWQITRGLASDAITDNSFTMPANEVKIKAVFEREYAIEVEAGGHGSASADVQKGVSGKEVTLTITPDEGYEVDQINVVRGGVTVTDNKFKIGAADVKIKVTFKAIKPHFTPPTAITGLVYNAEYQKLANEGSTSDGTMFYAVTQTTDQPAADSWKTTIDTKKDAGTYYLHFYVKGDETHPADTVPAYIAIVISKADNQITVTDNQIGESTYCVNQLSKDFVAAEVAAESSTSITYEIVDGTDDNVFYIPDPTKNTLAVSNNTPVGEYSIVIRANAAESKNYKAGSKDFTYTLTITKANPSYTAPTAVTGLVYDGQEQVIANEGITSDGAMLYAVTKDAGATIDENDWKGTIDKQKDAGKYYVHYYVKGDSNHNDSDEGVVETQIGQAVLSYTVTFMNDKTVTAPTEQTVKKGGKVTEPTPAPTTRGYTFVAWCKDKDGSNIAWDFDSDIVTEDTILYAEWKPKKFKITYKDEGGQTFTGLNYAELPKEHIYGTVTDLINAERKDLYFAGWFTDSDCRSNAVTELGETAFDADITLYAKWRVVNKDEAKMNISSLAGAQKEEIGSLVWLSNLDKQVYRDAIDALVTTANTAIDAAGTYAGVENAKSTAENAIQKQGYNAREADTQAKDTYKRNKKEEVYAYASEKSEVIDSMDWLTGENKKSYTTQIDEIVDGKAERTIESATNPAQVEAAVLDAKTAIYAIIANAEDDEITITYNMNLATNAGTISQTSETIKRKTGTATGATATAAEGYTFINWTDKEGIIVSTNAEFVPVKSGEGQDAVYVAGIYTANFAFTTSDCKGV